MDVDVSQSPPAHARRATYVRYLEGLRGLAALDVVLYHIWCHTLLGADLPARWAAVSSWIGAVLQGRIAVDVFIVLSGYLLMRPAARSPDGHIPGGTAKYLIRRARRILPPYYAALFLALALEFLIPGLRQPIDPQWSDSIPPFGAANIAAHLLMLHNLSWHWVAKIDSPLWTVATEWQIYFVFPFLLLPVWRRVGSLANAVFGVAIGLSPVLLLNTGHDAAPWYIGLFSFGMAAAARERAPRSAAADHRRFGLIAAALFVLYVIFVVSVQYDVFARADIHSMEDMWRCWWPMDILVGAATGFLIASLAAGAEIGHWLPRALSARWCVRLGVVSYSLYLIHDPLFAIMKLGMIHWNIPPWTQFFAMILIGLPVVLVITYIFHLIIEKPFMSARRVREAEPELARPMTGIVPSLGLQESLPK